MEKQVPMTQTDLNTGVTAGEKMMLKRFERQLKDRYIFNTVSTAGAVKPWERRKHFDGNTLLKTEQKHNQY
jgi:hypothetical protein